MKYKIPYRFLITLIFSFIFVFALRVEAQSIPKNRYSFTCDLGFGYSSFNREIPEFDPDEFMMISNTSRNSYTNLTMAFRFLLGTNLLDSRLDIGAEWTLQKIRAGQKSTILFWITDDDTVANVGPDAMIHSALIIGDYLVKEISDKVNINAAGGLGVLFFENFNTRMEYNQNIMALMESEESTIQLAASGRLLMPIRISSSITIDPEIRVLASAGPEKVFLVQFLVGLTYRL